MAPNSARTQPRAQWLTANYLLIALFTLSFAIFFCGMPRYLDDLWYSIHLNDWANGYKDISLWEAITTTWAEHCNEDNARMANIVFVPFLLLPKWVGSALAAVLLGISMIWSIKLARLSPARSPWICPAIFMWAFFMPWYDSMGVENFQFNYIYSTFFATAAMRIFFSADTQSKPIATGMALLTGIVAGCWHEGFAAPLIAGLGCIFLYSSAHRQKTHIYLLAGMAIGLGWTLMQPISWNRAENIIGANDFGISRIIFISFQHPAFILMTLAAILCLTKSKWRNIYRDPVVVALIINAIVSVGIHFLTKRVPRTGWWAEFTSIIALTMLLRTLMPSLLNKYTLRNIPACALLVATAFLHQTVADIYAVRINRTFNKAISEHLSTGNNVVFTDVITEHDAPLICLFMPDFTTFLAPDNLYFINLHYHYHFLQHDDQFIPIPRELRRVTALSGRPINGNAHVREFNGRMFIPTDVEGVTEFKAEVDFGYTTKKDVRMICYPFTSEADGQRYAFIYPWRRVVEMTLGHPVNINRTDDH